MALVAVDFPDQPFVMTLPKHSDLFGNPQIDPVRRDQVPQFYADFFIKPGEVNHGHTINGYWMEQSRGRFGITGSTPSAPTAFRSLYGNTASTSGARISRRPTAAGPTAASSRIATRCGWPIRGISGNTMTPSFASTRAMTRRGFGWNSAR